MWIEPVAHLSERKVCARVKWISATSRLSCRVFNPRYGAFGKYSNKFGLRKNWISVTSPQFTIIMSCLQSTSSIHTSEHSVNIRTNIRTNSAFGKILLSDNFRFRTLGYTLFFIAWIKFRFFIIFCLRHVFTITFVIIRYTKKFFKISFLALSGL